jgi:hypothetical protein
VVGIAFEVLNTTAVLYKQGTVTAYRMTQPKDQYIGVNTIGIDSVANQTYNQVTHRVFCLPPTTVVEAVVLPGSKQWEAERGGYCVGTLTDDENRSRQVDNLPRLYMEAQSWPSVSTAPCGALVSFISQAATSGYTVKYYSPLNTSGLYFTGLSYQTSLQVNLKVLYETFPDPRSSFATLACTSPDYDPEAIRLYTELACHIPPGVPVDENPSGEFFGHMLGTLGSLSTMAGAINPLFAVLGTGLGLASKILPGVIDSFEHTKKKKGSKKQQVVVVDSAKTTRAKAFALGRALQATGRPR